MREIKIVKASPDMLSYLTLTSPRVLAFLCQKIENSPVAAALAPRRQYSSIMAGSQTRYSLLDTVSTCHSYLWLRLLLYIDWKGIEREKKKSHIVKSIPQYFWGSFPETFIGRSLWTSHWNVCITSLIVVSMEYPTTYCRCRCTYMYMYDSFEKLFPMRVISWDPS